MTNDNQPFYGLAFIRKDGDKAEVLEFVPYPPKVELQVLKLCEDYLREKIEDREERIVGFKKRRVPACIVEQQQRLVNEHKARLARLQTEMRPVLEAYAEQWYKILATPFDDVGFDMESEDKETPIVHLTASPDASPACLSTLGEMARLTAEAMKKGTL